MYTIKDVRNKKKKVVSSEDLDKMTAAERKAAAKARVEAEPRIAAWKAMASQADDLEIEDED